MHSLKRDHLRLLLTPSLLSASVSILISLVLIVASIIISLSKAGKLQDDLFAVHYVQHGINSQYHNIALSLDSNHIISQLLLWVFWGTIGLIAYVFTVTIFRACYEGMAIKKSLNYVHAKPHSMIKELEYHLAQRLGAAIGLWLVIHFLLKNILPFSLAIIRNVSLKLTVISGLKLFGVFALLLAVFHVFTVLVRLLYLRPRRLG